MKGTATIETMFNFRANDAGYAEPLPNERWAIYVHQDGFMRERVVETISGPFLARRSDGHPFTLNLAPFKDLPLTVGAHGDHRLHVQRRKTA